jgi:hypothetical protein
MVEQSCICRSVARFATVVYSLGGLIIVDCRRVCLFESKRARSVLRMLKTSTT